MTDAKKKDYFTKDTERAILRFTEETDPVIKSQIYEKSIHKPLRKLAENLIYTYKFFYTEVSDLKHLEHQVEIFLLERLHKFDPASGFKAYSYFTRIALNYLISSNRKNYKKRINRENVDSLLLAEETTAGISEAFRQSSMYVEEDFSDSVDFENLSAVDFFELYVEYLRENMNTYCNSEKDLRILEALLLVFSHQRELDILNKKAIYLYVREMVDVSTSEITSVVKKIRTKYKEAYAEYLDKGLIIF